MKPETKRVTGRVAAFPGRLTPVVVLAALLAAGSCAINPKPLDIYFVDVEGGQATLLVTPSGETVLIDAGYPGKGKSDPVPGDPNLARDAQRIAAAARDANVSRIDYLLVSHFHTDHFGGVMELAQLIPIDTIIDHGTEEREAQADPELLNLLKAYKEVRDQRNYIVPKAGDRIRLENTEITVVSSAGTILESPIAGAGEPNSACDRPVLAPGNTVNPGSNGVLVQYGEFSFLDLADLVGQPLSDLVCPLNRIGRVDVYLISHHGGADAADSATFAAWRPRVAILNNGAIKGAAPSIFGVLRNSDGLEDVWQLHRSDNEGSVNFPSAQIANLDTRTEYWLRISANTDGSFRVLNKRTGVWKSYDSQGVED